MTCFDVSRIRMAFLKFVAGLLAMIPFGPAAALGAEGVPPVADAGLPRYAARDPVTLDGTGSYDPDDSGSLSYQWQQVAGPLVQVTDGDTATPTISGFLQTDAIQECEFELVVSDGELTSLPDTVKVIIVPVPAPDGNLPQLELKNDSFDPTKPTIVYFGGGDGTYGLPAFAWSPFRDPPWVRWAPMDPAWLDKANIIECPGGYNPDSLDTPLGKGTYYRCGDKIIVYLSSVAPNYKQAIQIIGHSTGGLPAMDVGLHLNLTYKDRRYAVNRVTLLDVGNLYWRDPGAEDTTINQFLASSVDGEQCWIDDYWWGPLHVFRNILNVQMPVIGHANVKYWYGASLTYDNMNQFNNGVVAGAYWSVIGPGKNLQLASTGDYTYVFRWPGGALEYTHGIELYDESSYPGRLPEPVTLVGPPDGATVDATGALLTCEESENAVGYQLLFGRDPYHLVYLFSDTPSPPSRPVSDFPCEQTWWTVRAYDLYGSTIHADPMYIHTESVNAQPIENTATGQTYASIQQAINDAHPGDEIAVSSGVCQYGENINFRGKNLTLRSTDPNDPAVVAATIINGGHRAAAVTFSGAEGTACVLDGLTITGGLVAISCRGASPTIRNCTIESDTSVAIEFWRDCGPTLVDCTVLGAVEGLNDPTLLAHWALDETEGLVAADSAGESDATVIGVPAWQPDGGRVNGALELTGTTFIMGGFVLSPSDGPFSVLAWVKGGQPGQGIITQQGGVDWLMADVVEGKLATELSRSLCSKTMITDGDWHRIGVTWDGSACRLYVDDVLEAENAEDGLASSTGGVVIGCRKTMMPGTFWTGLIDDIRIYNRAVKP